MYSLIRIGVYLDEYVINACKRLFSNKNPIILRGVIFALGDLARNFIIFDKNFYNSVINKDLVYSDQLTIDIK